MSHRSWALQCGKYGKSWIICILLPSCSLPISSAQFFEDIDLFVLCSPDFLIKNTLYGLMLASSFWFLWQTHDFFLSFFSVILQYNLRSGMVTLPAVLWICVSFLIDILKLKLCYLNLIFLILFLFSIEFNLIYIYTLYILIEMNTIIGHIEFILSIYSLDRSFLMKWNLPSRFP